MSEPSREHVWAVMEAMSARLNVTTDDWSYQQFRPAMSADTTSVREAALGVLTSTDPAVWDAIAAHIPMDALVRTGRLRVAHTPYRDEGGYRRSETRLVTEWTEAPDA